ncbi:cystathionine gamma-lyase-like [Agrilus planipennis]|uniref:cystathionine gamma-lyase n=1 Tax=Agrilus planipennis TaxID=224129 RepID=A0A1W4WE13_AGRPL|nr:cystathionine gamma-lyase-like [Agrilus planipennis]
MVDSKKNCDTIDIFNSGFLPFPKHFTTTCIHAAQEPEKWKSLAIVPPIIMSSTFKQPEPGQITGYEYGRFNNPTRETLEGIIKTLHGAKYAYIFGSGMGAFSSLLGLLKAGDNIICTEDIYGGTNKLFSEIAVPMGMTLTYVDPTNTSEFAKAVQPKTKLIWVESPTNPCLKLVDIQEVAKIAQKNNIILGVDNTFASIYLQRPLDLGATICGYSLTKYMNGHSDIIMGCMVVNDDVLGKRLQFLQMTIGAVPSPFDCSQVIRGIKTLEIRMHQHMINSLTVAKFLESHPNVDKVAHPGLPSHPQHDIAKKQMSGHSGMIALYLKGGVNEAKIFLKALKIFTVGISLGGYESLAQAPFFMTHALIPEEQRRRAGIVEGLIRMSIGLEDPEDLIADLNQALNKMTQGHTGGEACGAMSNRCRCSH